MWFSAGNLPEGLALNRETGQITGRIAKAGAHKITLIATNDLGEARKELRLVVGNTIALTPPMGWNSWNCRGCAVDEKKIREAAEAMVKSGLIHHGWQYINIGDCWMIRRDSDDATVGGPVRDLWRQKDLGVFEDTFGVEIPRHGVALVRLFPAD